MATEPLFDELVHNPVRLRICALLRQVDALLFSTMRETLDVSKPTLSKHLRTLAEAGYLTMNKVPSGEREDRRRVGWIRLSPAGRDAFDGHIAALQQITTSSLAQGVTAGTSNQSRPVRPRT
ncbi:transcriptional regulator [Georgenia sp. SYP-B2076]|uniref:transcriptional regulator n=1 Tax=Georgenia sp. SYP-B2076 TaxID=2495881 RepID=UPI000F8D11BA|nr:transcriptional regulator [Georgenia sp. SYP-B2076]